MTESNVREKRRKTNKMNWRFIRISLKYRPDIFKLVCKMRLCIHKKNVVIKKLESELKQMKCTIVPCADVEMVSNHDDVSVSECKVAKEQLVDNETPDSIKDLLIESENMNNAEEISKEQNESNIPENVDAMLENNESRVELDSILNNEKPNSTKDSLTQTEILVKTENLMNETSKKVASQYKSRGCQVKSKHFLNTGTSKTKDSSTQTEESEKKDKGMNESSVKKKDKSPEIEGWDLQDGEEKSIAEQVKEVAQSALEETGMVYVDSAGMYYDYKTGYYYNSELGLYYHTDTGCYYYYSEDKKTFVFHSYPDRSAENPGLAAHERKKAKKHQKGEEDGESSKPKKRKVSKKISKKAKKSAENGNKDGPEETAVEKEKIDETPNENKEGNADAEDKSDAKEKEDPVADQEMEDGECSDTDSDASTDEDNKSVASTSTASDDDTIAKHHPPCMRIIVRETNVTKLKVGNLFLITKDGGTIGREGEQHAIVIRDTNISRNHLDIKYDMGRKMYLATDLGSKNGTMLNGIRMSESQDISIPMEVMHGSTIQLGETKLLCHIHPGNDTCGHCEPGLIMETQEQLKAAYTRTCSVQKQHQLELARLKNKYAPKPLMIEATAYNDRAQQRRQAVGSTHHAEKTQSSDLGTSISSENKGFKLLEKMGWSKGEGLGKDSQGGTEPIPLVSNDGTKGLGSAPQKTPSATPTVRISKLGPATLRLAAKTKMLSKPAKAFQDQMDDEESE